MQSVLGWVLLASLVLAGPAWSGPSGALSYLKPGEAGRCHWMRQPLPAGKPVTVFTFDAACERSVVAFSPDGRKGLVFTRLEQAGEVPQAWRVDFAARTGKALDLAALPGGRVPVGLERASINRISFDRKGRVVALIEDHYGGSRPPTMETDGKEALFFEGQRYPLGPMGDDPALVMAYRLEGANWKRFETKATYFTSVPGGLEVLKVTRTLQPVTSSVNAGLVGQDVPRADAAMKRLKAAFPKLLEGQGKWMRLSTPGGPLYYWASVQTDKFLPAAPVRLEVKGKLVDLPGFSAGQDATLGLRVQGALLLISSTGAGEPTAQVFDTRKRKRLLEVENAVAPVFWP